MSSKAALVWIVGHTQDEHRKWRWFPHTQKNTKHGYSESSGFEVCSVFCLKRVPEQFGLKEPASEVWT